MWAGTLPSTKLLATSRRRSTPTHGSAKPPASYTATLSCGFGIRRQHSSECECDRDPNNYLAHIQTFPLGSCEKHPGFKLESDASAEGAPLSGSSITNVHSPMNSRRASNDDHLPKPKRTRASLGFPNSHGASLDHLPKPKRTRASLGHLPNSHGAMNAHRHIREVRKRSGHFQRVKSCAREMAGRALR